MTHNDSLAAGKWFSITPTEARSPLIAHVPHAAELVPEAERAGILLDDEQLAHELLASTDHFTDGFGAEAIQLGGVVVAPAVSRLVVDVERFTDDGSEPQAQVGRGAVYTSTTQGVPLRRFDPVERERLLGTYFEPYHAAFGDLVEQTLGRWGRCLIVDVHSYPSASLHYELDQGSVRPGVCIGTDPFHTPEALTVALERAARDHGASTARDRPFGGTFVPLPHYGADRRVVGAMLEIRRDLYMDEATGHRSAGFEPTRRLVAAMLAAAVEAVL